MWLLSIRGLPASSTPEEVEGATGNSNFLPTTLGSLVASSASTSSPESVSVPSLCEAVRFLQCSTLGGGLGSEAADAVRLSFLGGEMGIGEESSIDRYRSYNIWEESEENVEVSRQQARFKSTGRVEQVGLHSDNRVQRRTLRVDNQTHHCGYLCRLVLIRQGYL